MKIFFIIGSSRRGNTGHAAERIREFMQGRLEFEWERGHVPG
jgi:flavodoxin